MTQSNILERKKLSLEIKKCKIKQLEASVKTAERKARTRQLIELGGLVSKAGLDSFDTNTLLGALLEVSEKSSDKKILNAWTHKGGIAFNQEKSQKVAVTISFTEKPTSEIRVALKDLGLKWNPLRKEWEGYAEKEKFESLKNQENMKIQFLQES